MDKTIKFFLKDKYKATYAIQAKLYEESEGVIIKVFNFDKEKFYTGCYSSYGSCLPGGELRMPLDSMAYKILGAVFRRLQ